MRVDVHDVMALAHGVRWDAAGRVVEDVLLDAHHRVNASAAAVLDLVAQGCWTFGESALLLADRYGLDEDRARADVLELLHVLDDHALVTVRRPRRLVWSPAAVSGAVAALATGGDLFLAHRLPATVAGIVRATARILLWPTALLLLGAAALVTALQGVQPDAGRALLAESVVLVLALVLCLWITMALHELGHLMALRGGRDRAVLVVRGWRMALLHRSGTSIGLVGVALAGPMAGVVGGVLVALLGLVDVLGREFAAVSCAVGLSHLVHLGPWAADGAMLRRGLARGGADRAVA